MKTGFRSVPKYCISNKMINYICLKGKFWILTYIH